MPMEEAEMTRLPCGALLLAALLAVSPARALEVSGPIDADTAWVLADSPIEVTADVTIAAGATLTVEAGVEVRFAADVTLRVQGGLVARGTDAAPVVLAGASPAGGGDPARWQGIVFEDTSEDARFEEVGRYAGGSIVEGCLLRDARRALSLLGASPYLHDSVLSANVFDCPDAILAGEIIENAQGGAALYVGPGSAPRVVGCVFEDNEAAFPCQGGAVYVDQADPLLQGNVFARNFSTYGGALATDRMAGPIVGNLFEDNEALSEGGGLAQISSCSALLDNVVRRNYADMDGGGVHICVTCYPHANPTVLDNRIMDNENASEGAAGFGAAYLRAGEAIDVFGNLQGATPSDFAWHQELSEGYPAWVASPSIAGNWWGTTDPDAVAATVHDGADEAGLGQVTFLPIADAPVAEPTLRAVITSRKIRYDTPTEPMPVFLTLYNPGPARDIELAITLELGDGLALPYLGEVGLAGAQRVGPVVRAHLPEGVVHFARLDTGRYAGPGQWSEGRWHLALFDAASGERLDGVRPAGFVLAAGGAR